MGMHTLYGRGAITISDDRHEYRPVNGAIQVPDHLVNRAKAAGFTTFRLPEAELVEAEAAPTAAVDPVDPKTPPPSEPATDPSIERPVIDATLSDDELLFQFTMDAIDAGYEEDAAATIARERIEHLRSGGDGYGRGPVAATGATE